MKSRFDLSFLENASETLRALAHPIRLAILDLLHIHNRLTVTEIHEALEIEQAVASHHLRILKDRQVLVAQRDGKNTYYALRTHIFGNILQSLGDAQ
ncbi:MAG: metalloregulator ArsR/SmtB family transcription factor [Bacteroidia bacterium]|nr:metalloregulator ArsR/SmtB family transcription factor [Bacteroidia bacterium]